MNCLIRFHLHKTTVKLNFSYKTLGRLEPNISKQCFSSFASRGLLNGKRGLNAGIRLNIFVRNRQVFKSNNLNSSKKGPINIGGIRRLLSLAKPDKYHLMGAMILLLISSGVTMLVPFFLGKLIDFIQNENKDTLKEKLQTISLWMVLVFLIGAAANFGRVYIIQSTGLLADPLTFPDVDRYQINRPPIEFQGQRIIMRLRERLFRSLMMQEMAFFDKNKTGELINRLSSDTEIVGTSVSQNLSDGLRSIVQLSGGVGMMLYVSPTLGIIGLSSIPAVTLFAVFFGRYIKRLSKKVQDVLAEATDVAEEKISNIRTVRAFAQEDKETQTYSKSINRVMAMKLKEALAYGVFYGTTGFSGNFIVLSVFYFGGTSIANGSITIGDLSAFLMYSVWVGISIAGLSSFYTELMRGIGASTRTWEIIDRQPTIPIINNVDTTKFENCLKGDITFENITFAYPTRIEQNIFKNFNLTIPGGKILAVVGSSGSGKSTLGSLILRFYDPDQGTVKIGGVDIRDMPQSWLRNHIGTVPQDICLFSTTIKDNIAYGVPDPESITSDQIYEATHEANAFSFIESMPDKFNTVVGERGTNLSGGQRQRLAIARAILRDPQILLLDEATSALDAASEYLVQEALDRIMENRTVIIIAHRLSTIKNADLIAVLDKGQVVELGSYNELMQKDTGTFRELVARQTVDVDYSVQ